MQSTQIEKLSIALAKVQSGLTGATATGVNPAFGKGRKYATLDDVWDLIRKPLADNELSVSQGVDRDDKGPFVWTLLMHSSGQWLRAEMPLILGKSDPQGVGAALTYYRRYSLAAIVGVTQEDDDAQSAQPGKASKQEQPKPAPKPVEAAPAGTPTAAFTKHKAALHACKDLTQLSAAWQASEAEKTAMRPAEREELAKLKNKRKTDLSPTSQAA